MFTKADHEYMSLALRLAEKGLYTTTPNPRVGCVLVNKGQIIGQGAHLKAGEPHAEIMALRDAASNFSWAKLLKTDITSLWLLKKLLMPFLTIGGKTSP